MKVAVVGKSAHLVKVPLKEHGFTVVKKNPDLVISFGGDGTSLYGERVYPGIPRVLIRHSKICKTCPKHDYATIFNALKAGKYSIVEQLKLEARINNLPQRFIALNEIDIHHKVPHAVRLQVSINGRIIKELVIGDGVLVATPHGSTAYFNSMTGKSFSKGLGIAFNNAVTRDKPLFADENAVIKVKVLRGPALLVSDNSHKMPMLEAGDVITIRKSSQKARIVKIMDKQVKLLRGNFVAIKDI
ncbi:NAD(+)/NADH kinase [Candidatus Woesearchaeota archaeon]|nr:NAD(+)/NADH kinase [Candidatus Woesearchaeota archaeon]